VAGRYPAAAAAATRFHRRAESKPPETRCCDAGRDIKAMPDTSSRYIHMAKNQVLSHFWAKGSILFLLNSNVSLPNAIDFSHQQIADALQKYDAHFGSFY